MQITLILNLVQLHIFDNIYVELNSTSHFSLSVHTDADNTYVESVQLQIVDIYLTVKHFFVKVET